MIHIEQNQDIPENENLVVFSPSGNYEDHEIIECCNRYDLSVPICGFVASFIRYGGLVNRFNDPKELGEAILEVDPESTHSAASYLRMTDELEGKMNDGSLEPGSLDKVLSNEQAVMEEKITETNQLNQTPVEKIETTTTKIDEGGNVLETTTTTTTTEQEIPVVTEDTTTVNQVESVAPALEEIKIEDPSVVVPEVNLIEDTIPAPVVDQPVSILKKSIKKIV